MGGGTIMSPVLIRFSGVAPSKAVGTTLLYATAVNFLVFLISARLAGVLTGGLPATLGVQLVRRGFS
jgi:uncharacterized membrane protein YfcA